MGGYLGLCGEGGGLLAHMIAPWNYRRESVEEVEVERLSWCE